MTGKDISSKKFDRGFNGYKLDDVDTFLSEVASEFTQLQKDNRDLEKKLEVLADKVREYRDDEEALKEALLGAQKQGREAIAEANGKAKKILEEAQSKSDAMGAEARENSAKMKKEAEENLKNANNEAKRIHDEATKKNEKMEEEYKNKLDINKEILYKTKNEVNRFRQKILEDFTRVTGVLEALPESCENEFISKTLSEYQKERNVTLKKPAVMKPAEEQPDASANVKKKSEKPRTPLSNINLGNGKDDKADLLKDDDDNSDALYDEFEAQMAEGKKSTSFEVNVGENMLSDLTTEIHFEAVFEEGADENSDEELGKDNNEDKDNPFFKKGNTGSKDREVLEFGNNVKKTANKK